MYRYPVVPFNGGIGSDMLMLLFMVGAVALMIAVVFALHFVLYAFEFVVQWFQKRRSKRTSRPNFVGANPFENWPEPQAQPAVSRKKPLYRDDEDRLHVRRSPVRLLYSAAFERLTDAQLDLLRVQCGGAVDRLRRAVQLLALGQTSEAERLLVVAAAVVHRAFDAGPHWLEAIILADLAALCHHRNSPEEADAYFERAAAIGELWFESYPWLRKLCTRRRLVR